jgi:uncharacterized protein YfaS (alpha-2-macroglobulin family)
MKRIHQSILSQLPAFIGRCRDLLFAAWCVLPALLLLPWPGVAATIETFSPQGEVMRIRQVRAGFSEAMVPFGEPQLREPFTIRCVAEGAGRWADEKNWVYDFDKDLPAGIECTFTLKPEVRSLRGNTVTGKRAFLFSTGGPSVTEIFPAGGTERIFEDQVFVITPSGDMDEETVRTRASCYIADSKERIAVKIVTGEERERILEAHLGRSAGKDGVRTILLQCARVFPAQARVSLIWGKGIASKSGVPTGKDQVFHYKTRDPFTASFRCSRENLKSACIPILPMMVRFSAPVPRASAEKITLSGGKGPYRPKVHEGPADFAHAVEFPGPFPEKAQFIVTLPAGLRDDSGRALVNAARFPVTVRTGPYPPLAKFSGRFGIIERDDPVLPVTVRNLEAQLKGKILDAGEEGQGAGGAPPANLTGKQEAGGTPGKIFHTDSETEVIRLLRALVTAGRRHPMLAREKHVQDFVLPKPRGRKAFEVMGIPLGNSGFHLVELESAVLGTSLLGPGRTMYVSAGALVTNLSAHFKWGRESSIVWVTTLSNAKPVKDARVTLRDCSGQALWEGRTDGEGIARIEKGLPRENLLKECRFKPGNDYLDTDWSRALSGIDSGLFVFARAGDDMTFVHSSWDDGIEPYRFKLPTDNSPSPLMAHTIFDRTLFRAGDTVHMKHILRKRAMAGMELVKHNLPDTLRIIHGGTSTTYEMALHWNLAAGSAENLWKIPKEARLGLYTVTLVNRSGKKDAPDDGARAGTKSGKFRVEEFRVPLLKAAIKPVEDVLIRTPQVEIDVSAEYLAGGAARGLPVKIRGMVRPKTVHFDDYEHFTVGNGGVKEGIARRGDDDQCESPDFRDDGEEAERAQRPGPENQRRLSSRDLTLGPGGVARTSLQHIPVTPRVQELLAEAEFRDPNGEIQTVSRAMTIWPSQILLGIETASWASSQEALKFHVVALDLQGKPLDGVRVTATLYGQKHYSHRKRLMGGFYAYEHVREVKKAGPLCEGLTNRQGLLICEVTSPLSGNVIIEAGAADSTGNLSAAFAEAWVYGKEDAWFEAGDTDRIDLLPEKKRYEPGEVAKFQVRMPMREATVLVTVEREGIIDVFVQEVSGKYPVIEVPVKESYAPNIFVSVLCVRGRIAGSKPTATFDPGKPSYKLGITGIAVGWQAQELKVRVSPDREVYRTREKAIVKIKVTAAMGKPLPKGGETTLAVVDEGVLELMPNKSWHLLEAMMQKRGYCLQTSTGQMQVVGKRHYGLKALPRGGGGGKGATRELFDTLLFWRGTIPLDDNGEASLTVPLNDSITGFAVVAVATAGADMAGTGEARIRTTRDLILLPGLPQFVRQGDRYQAKFTIRNASKQHMEVETRGRYGNKEQMTDLPPLTEKLEGGEARETGWDVKAPPGGDMIRWIVSASDKGSGASDSVSVTQKTIPVTATRVIQATTMQLENDQSMEVKRPPQALPGRGGVRLSFRPRLTDEVSGIVSYMEDYPYRCMEQKVSRAVSLNNEAMWKEIVGELPAHLDPDGLVKYFSSSDTGSDVLTSYILAVSHEAGWTMPAHARERMEEGLEKFLEGRIQRHQPRRTTDLLLRKISALEALSRHKALKPTLLESITGDPNLWPTSAVIDGINILKRVAYIANREERLDQAEQILRSRLTFQGTTMNFSTERTDRLWWLMVDGDVNSVRTILAFLGDPRWKKDMPGLMKGAIARQLKGKWSTTTANAWGRVALTRFGNAFETAPVQGVSTATLGRTESFEWARNQAGKALFFPWPKSSSNLSITHEGGGAPWVAIQSLAAIPRLAPFSSGFAAAKTYAPLERKNPGHWSTGDVLRVRLDLEAQSDMTWVVVSDPIPAGASILGSKLGRDSALLGAGPEKPGQVRPVFTERSFEAFRAYYDFVPKGKWSLEYVLRLNNEGTYQLPETRIEALYAPEMFGEIPNGPLEIQR